MLLKCKVNFYKFNLLCLFIFSVQSTLKEKDMKNRSLIAFVLTIAMLISLVPVGVFAEPQQPAEPQEVEGSAYSFYAQPYTTGSAITEYTITTGANDVYILAAKGVTYTSIGFAGYSDSWSFYEYEQISDPMDS